MNYQLLEYLGSALLVLSFWTRLPVHLRRFAIASNVVFIVYGSLGHIVPVVVINGILLPLNVLRVVELQRLQAKVQRALESDLSLDWLRPMMQRRHAKAGEYLFHQGDAEDNLYYIVSGSVRLVEIDVVLTAGHLMGEMAVFTPSATRTLSARCEEPVELMSMPAAELLKLYYRDPDFGVYLVRLIARRFLHNVDVLQGLATERETHLNRLKHLAKVDETTGLGDWAGTETRLRTEWARATRVPAPLTLVVAKAGYEASAEELRLVATALLGCVLRASDFIGRDGPEFMAILPHTDAPSAEIVTTKMRDALAALPLSGSFAIGMATARPERGVDPLSLLTDARAAATFQTA